jgi:hypothetical protein
MKPTFSGRTRLAGLATALLLAVGVGMANPAQAAGSIVNNNDGSITADLSGVTGPSLNFCDNLVDPSDCGRSTTQLFSGSKSGVYKAGSNVIAPVSGGGRPTSLPAGTYTVALFALGVFQVGLSNVVISSVEDFGPADVTQQIGKPAAGCEKIDRPDLDWAGVPSGGWNASWAEWANEGKGGAVCARTLSYSLNTETWFVRA